MRSTAASTRTRWFPRAVRLWALLCALPAAAQFSGSAACAVCHLTEYRAHSGSPHAHALARAATPGEWAFGAGVKAITYISRTADGDYVERGRSYFSRTHAFGATPGHADGADLSYPALAAGASIARCFRCHSTGPLRLGAALAIEPAESGVGCEACHGPGARHIAAGGDSQAIGNPARLNAVELNQFCGTCHRKPPEPDESAGDQIAAALKFDWSNRWNVRHQPAYLSQSACFRGSGGALSCLSCHDPHSVPSLPLADYDRRCAACHQKVQHTAAISGPCAGCHMPSVTATAEMQFAGHWIGIYRGLGATTPVDSTRNRAPLVLPSTPEGKRPPPNDPSTMRPLFEQALAERRDRFGAQSAEAARGAWLLGAFLKELGTPAAEQPLREALAIDRANASPDAAADALELAQVLQAAGKREEAVERFGEAARGGNARVAAQAYASLARMDPSNAAANYKKAVAAEESLGRESPRVAALLSNLALALRARGEFAPAEAALRRALQIQDQAFGRGHFQSAVSMNNLATVLQSASKLQEAERLERESVSIFERSLPSSPELAAAYANLAGLLTARKDSAAAAAFLRLAIATDQAAGGKNTLEEAADLASLARALRENDAPQAQALLHQALSIYELRTGPQSKQAAGVRKALAEMGAKEKP